MVVGILIVLIVQFVLDLGISCLYAFGIYYLTGVSLAAVSVFGLSLILIATQWLVGVTSAFVTYNRGQKEEVYPRDDKIGELEMELENLEQEKDHLLNLIEEMEYRRGV